MNLYGFKKVGGGVLWKRRCAANQEIHPHINTYSQKNSNFYLTLSGLSVESFPKLPQFMARKRGGRGFLTGAFDQERNDFISTQLWASITWASIMRAHLLTWEDVLDTRTLWPLALDRALKALFTMALCNSNTV